MGRALRPSTPGSYLLMRGALPLCTPQVGAPGPHDPHGEGAPPLHPGELSLNARGFAPLHSPSGGPWPPRPPWGGRSAPPPRVTFPSRGKSPKARQGLRPLESRQCEETALFGASLRLHPGYFLPLKKTDLPLLGCGQIGLVFSFGFIEEIFSSFNPWRGGYSSSAESILSIA